MHCLEERIFALEIELDLLKTFIDESELPDVPPSVLKSLAKPGEDELADIQLLTPEEHEEENKLLLPPFRISTFSGRKNDNWRRRCRCQPANTCSTKYGGESWFQVNVEVDDFDVRVILVPFEHTSWRSITDSPRQYRFFNTEGKYVTNFYDGSGGGAWTNKGTLGIEVLHKGSDRVHSRWIENPDFNTWGTNWFRCGIDYKLELKNP